MNDDDYSIKYFATSCKNLPWEVRAILEWDIFRRSNFGTPIKKTLCYNPFVILIDYVPAIISTNRMYLC